MRSIILAALAVCAVYAPAYAQEKPLEERLNEYSRLCKVAADAYNLADAALYCGKANALKPMPANLVNLGSALYMNGRYEQARFYFIEAMNINPKFAVAHFNLGRACDMLGKKECALQQYHEAAELGDPDAAAELALQNTVAVAAPKS